MSVQLVLVHLLCLETFLMLRNLEGELEVLNFGIVDQRCEEVLQ
jgi:hypothetical protein